MLTGPVVGLCLKFILTIWTLILVLSSYTLFIDWVYVLMAFSPLIYCYLPSNLLPSSNYVLPLNQMGYQIWIQPRAPCRENSRSTLFLWPVLLTSEECNKRQQIPSWALGILLNMGPCLGSICLRSRSFSLSVVESYINGPSNCASLYSHLCWELLRPSSGSTIPWKDPDDPSHSWLQFVTARRLNFILKTAYALT